MAGNERFDDAIGSWLQDAAPDRLPQRVLEATFEQTRRSRQRVDWREVAVSAQAPRIVRALGGVALVLVAAVLAFSLLRAPGFGGLSTPSPSAGTPAPTPTVVPTGPPLPAPLASGIAGWTIYTSEVYGISVGYPEDWDMYEPATHSWRAGDPVFDFSEATDVFTSADGLIGLFVSRLPAGPGADIESREGLAAWAEAVCDLKASECQGIPDVVEPMCLGAVACLPAVLVSLPDAVFACFADTETRMVTVVQIGREDRFPGASRYGGSVQLLKSILTTMDVWTPEPGQIPSGS